MYLARQFSTQISLVFALTLLALCSAVALAEQHGPQAARTQASRVIHSQPSNDDFVAPKKIYSNLGPAGDLYDANNGYFISGADNQFNFREQRIAMPFTPGQNATVTRVKAALQYYGFGTNGAVLAIYDDAGGLPGNILTKKRLANFDDFGSGCCNLAMWTLDSPLPVNARTQYWVVAATNNKMRDAINTWDFVFNDAPGKFAYEQDGGGWILINASFGYSLSTVAVRGTIP